MTSDIESFNKSMKIAIFYTGELRTVEKTMPFFKQNVLLQGGENPCRNIEFHVFATVQTSPDQQMKYETFLRENIGTNLSSLHWFERSQYSGIQTQLLKELQETTDLSSGWIEYLRTSGSMVEYYQLFLSYQQMVMKEQAEGFRFDSVVRIRPDIVLTRPLTFDWLLWNTVEDKQGIINRFIEISRITEKGNNIFGDDNIELFINTLYDYPLRLKKRGLGDFTHNKSLINGVLNRLDSFPNLQLTDLDEIIEKMRNYIHKGRYMVSIRKNVFYFMSRDCMTDICELGVSYGRERDTKKYSHWFDAESQLTTLCEKRGVSVFNSTMGLEDLSLYNYKTDNYFDESGGLKQTEVFCFILRS